MIKDILPRWIMAASALIASSAIFYYYAIHLPARQAEIDARQKAVEIATQQERCGKLASNLFQNDLKQPITNTSDGQNINSYQSHYSPELNKCFYETSITSAHTQVSPQYSTESLELFDADEGKEYGSFFMRSQDASPFVCRVLDKSCSSREQWFTLAKLYIGGPN